LTIQASGGQLIDGQTSLTLGTQYQSATLTAMQIASGTWGWVITAQTPIVPLYTAENVANKNQPNGYAGLNSSGFIPSALIVGTSDIIVEVATYSALPTIGSANTIYVTIDTLKQYRWGGTAYAQIDPSPGTTDGLTEGSINLYFTYARVLGALLTGLNTTISGTIAATDSVLSAFGKLQNAVTSGIALSSVFQGYITTLQGQVTNAAIIGQHLTGFTPTNGTVSGSSTILSALENLQYEISNARILYDSSAYPLVDNQPPSSLGSVGNYYLDVTNTIGSLWKKTTSSSWSLLINLGILSPLINAMNPTLISGTVAPYGDGTSIQFSSFGTFILRIFIGSGTGIPYGSRFEIIKWTAPPDRLYTNLLWRAMIVDAGGPQNIAKLDEADSTNQWFSINVCEPGYEDDVWIKAFITAQFVNSILEITVTGLSSD
jgi:hypothetical protein